MNEWISVKDKLPNKGKIIICFTDEMNNSKHRIEVGIYERGFYFCNIPIDSLVTHWMPFPEFN